MKRIMFLLAATAMMALAAGLLSLALGAKPTQAQAVTDTINERTPFEFQIPDPCTGELVFIEGTQHIVSNDTQDSTGESHLKGHVNLQAQGESASGAKYVAARTTNDHQNLDGTSESAENFTFTQTLQFIRKGSETPEDDFQAQFLFHATRNANGEFTAEIENVEVVCR